MSEALLLQKTGEQNPLQQVQVRLDYARKTNLYQLFKTDEFSLYLTLRKVLYKCLKKPKQSPWLKNLRYRILKTEDRYYFLDVERPFLIVYFLPLLIYFVPHRLFMLNADYQLKKWFLIIQTLQKETI